MDYAKHRNELIGYLRRSLLGPGSAEDAESDDHTLNQLPSFHFPVGLLFPVLPGGESRDPSVVDDDDDAIEDDETTRAEPVKRAPFVPPSSVGYTFHASRDVELHIFPWATRYECADGGKNAWRRVPLTHREATVEIFTPPDQACELRRPLWGGRAQLYLAWREHEDGWLVTVSLANRQEAPWNWRQDEQARREFESRILFEVELRCVIVRGRVQPYPEKDPALMDEEEQTLELLYRDHHIYGVGHGAAVDWTLDEQQRVVALFTDFLPRAEAPRVTADNPELDKKTLNLDYLAEVRDRRELLDRLGKFVDAYAAWRLRQADELAALDDDEQAIGERLAERIDTAIQRMRAGIDLLAADETAMRAFQWTNHIMRRQMRQRARNPDKSVKWRPFQLGFILLTLSSVQNEADPFRDTVDLIWFPTGGGKTEAYLAVIAWLILYRRMAFGEQGGGTAVIMRYTLRLLTQQQFERAVSLIFALELLRRERPDALGEEPITAGLWVGSATSPNTFKAAREALKKEPETPRELIFTECPWCDTPLWGRSDLPVEAFHCPNADCEMNADGQQPLPMQVIDQALYRQPPALLFATIDKFARLPWEERAHVFFGCNGQRPPELIVQDELHLVSSALGSVAGLYEAALDSIIRFKGVRPKIIASTATIRDAERQVRRLYAREHAVFPPSGLSADDAFFTRTVPLEQAPGRLYLGFMPAMMNRRDAFSRLAAALLEAPLACFGDADEPSLLDAWWTLLIYHGSLRGVGQSHNSLLYDVARQLQESGIGEHRLPLKVSQLTSVKSAQENAATFERLEKGVDHSDHVDVALATNMISVGLDVGRLALMIVNGQPLTTAEYIQATSRVGRAGVPGLIVANYYRHQARSLSHLEHFRPYHESFYRYVEPTSVTPFTYQARKRALHAALVSLMRHALEKLRENLQAQRFNSDDPEIDAALEMLAQRCRQADPERGEDTEQHLRELARAWSDKAKNCAARNRRLVYSTGRHDKSVDALLYSHGDRQIGLWETLNSMRNVEDTARVYATGIFDPPCAGERT